MLKKVKRLINGKVNKNEVYKSYVGFLKTVPFQEKSGDRSKNIGVLVCPWLNTPVPWFSITLALILQRLSKYRVSIVVNDLWLKFKDNAPHGNYTQTKAIVKVLKKNKIISQNVDIIYLSQVDVQRIKLSEEDYTSIESIAELNTIRHFLNSFGIQSIEWEAVLKNCKEIFIDFYPYIKAIICLKQWNKFIIPGGFFLESGLFSEELKRQHVTMITYDAGINSTIFLGINGMAAKHCNIADSVTRIADDTLRMKACEGARKIFSVRKAGKEDIGVAITGQKIQTKCYTEKQEKQQNYDIIMFLNLEHDTAALGAHKVFKNDKEWVLKTIEYVINNTDYTIAVREHPMQRIIGYSRIQEEIDKFDEKGRVTFIPFDADVNSYNLIENSKVVVACTSTVGLEAAMCGKKVVLDTECYYGNASFVCNANTIEEYFSYIEDIAKTKAVLSKDAIKEAELYYYLTQRCGGIITDFSPQPYKFIEWSKRTFDDLINDEAIITIVKSIVEEIPLSYLLFNEIMQR